MAGLFQSAGRSVVCGERPDPLRLLVGERPVAGLGGALVLVFGVGELAQLSVPVGFELVGDEPVGRVHSEVAPAGGVGGVLGALHAHLADPVGVLGALGELGRDGERGLDRQRGELLEHELGDSGVDAGAADRLAWRGAGRDPLARAVVVRQQLAVAASVVADRHPLAAGAADDDALQQRRSLTGGSGATLLAAVSGGVRRKRLLVALVLVEGDVSGVRVGDQHRPLVAWLEHGAGVAVDVGELLASPIEVRAGIAGVVQREQHEVVTQRLPVGLAGVRPSRGVSAGEPELVGGELLDDGVRRAGLLEAFEQVRDRAAHLGVGVECHVAELVIGQADGQPDAQLAAGGLGEQPALQPCADEVKLRLGDRAFETEQEPVVDRARVIEPVLVADQRARQRAQLQQPVPVSIVARQPRALQAEHDPGLAQRHVRDQALEPLAVGGRRAGQPLVDIDHDHSLSRPAERDRPATQVVLTAG